MKQMDLEIPASIRCIAVTKKQSIEKIHWAISQGITSFGENYCQEALPKIEYFRSISNLPIRKEIVEKENIFLGSSNKYSDSLTLKPERYNVPFIEWHYIGKIQSNKTKLIATCFDWAQTICRIDIAKRLNNARGDLNLPPLNICIQINNAKIPQQSGITFQELPSLVHTISLLPHLKFRGLMTMVKADYENTAKVFHDLKKEGYDVDTLSMGMSDDYLYAIKKGATMVRLGTLLFGERK